MATGGQYALASGGHFALVLGGQFEWFFQILYKFSILRLDGYLAIVQQPMFAH
jgi:hypothetical protein